MIFRKVLLSTAGKMYPLFSSDFGAILAPKTAHFGVRNRYRRRMLNNIAVLSNSGPIWVSLGAHLASQNGAKIDPTSCQTASRRPEGLRRASGIDFRPISDRFLLIFGGFSRNLGMSGTAPLARKLPC